MSEERDPTARVIAAAAAVAAYPPAKPGQYVSDAKVRWPLIIELRQALDALGIAWAPAPTGEGYATPSRP